MPWQQQSSALQTMGVQPPETTSAVAPQAAPRNPQVDGLLMGLRSHLKSLGQEANPEVEAYLAKSLGSGPQAIKHASQRLEASGKTAAKLKVELAQLTTNWSKFQQKLEQEYEEQKKKFKEKKTQIQEGLKKAEEEYQAAQEPLQEAAAVKAPTAVPEVPGQKEEEKPELNGTPKRKAKTEELEDEDPLQKKLRTPDEVIPVPDSPALQKMDF